jgi:hypothetical protein
MLFEQWLRAGAPSQAARYSLAAARAAVNRLAFDRAAELIALALPMRNRGNADWRLRATYALALANAGRAADAAREYVEVSRSLAATPGSESLLVATQQVRAAEQFLYGGLLSDGLALLRKVFGALRLPFPAQGRIARLLSYANRLAVLPMILGVGNFRPRLNIQEIPQDILLRLDTLWVAAKGTVMLDYAVGDVITSRYLREALQAREPSRALRAMGLEASVYANVGRPWMLRRSVALMEHARELSVHSADPYDRAMMHVCDTTIAWCGGRWRACQKPAALALSALAECSGTNFDVAIVQGFALSARVFLGDLSDLNDAVLRLLEDARRRGDRYIQNVFQSGYLVYLHLADDDWRRALEKAEATLEEAPKDRFTSLHFHYFNAYTTAQLYAGQPDKAWQHVISSWPSIENAGFLKLACIGAHLRDLRARAALALAVSGRKGTVHGQPDWDPRDLMRIATSDARKIARLPLPHAPALASVICAGVAAVRGDSLARKQTLVAAARGFRDAEMAMHEEAVELELSRLEGDVDQLTAIVARMKKRGIRDPDRMTAVLVPSAHPR